MKRKKTFGQKKQVLLYHVGAQEEALLGVLHSLSIPARVLNGTELDETIGYLCGIYGFPPAGSSRQEEPPAEALLIFSGISRTELDKILSAARQAGLTVPALKAMVTQTNRNWTVRQLIDEIQKEHQLMHALAALKRLRQSVSLEGEPDDALLRAAAHADVLLNGMKQPTLAEVQQAERELNEALK